MTSSVFGAEARIGLGRELFFALVGWVLVGAIAGALIASFAIRVNSSLQGPGQAGPFLVLAMASYALVFGMSGVVVGLAGRCWGRSRVGIRTHALAAIVGFAGFIAGKFTLTTLNWLGDQDPLNIGCALALGFSLAIACRLCLGHFESKVHAWLVVVLVLGSAAFVFLSVARNSSPDPSTSHAVGPVLEVARLQSGELPRVMLIGVDGADWGRLKPLIEAGRLPHFAQLCDGGYTAPLATTKPTLSPVIWTTIVTGVPEQLHGVLDFTSVWLPGLSRGVQWSYAKYGSDARLPHHVGLVSMIGLFVRHGWLDETPIDALQRRQKALWNILSENGVKSGFVRWWATWPAEQFDGWMLSDNDPLTQVFAAALAEHTSVNTARENMTWPTELADELLPLIKLDGAIVSARKGQSANLLEDPIFAELSAAESEELRAASSKLATFELIVRGDRFATRSAIRLWNEHHVPMLGVYLRAVDNISHRFGRRTGVVDNTYEFMDERLGELLEAGGADTTYVLVSDHGWQYGPGEDFGHHDAPPGVIIVKGPGVRPTSADLNPSVLDIAPTILALYGLPPSVEMTGKPLLEVFAPGTAAFTRRERIETYGAYRPVWPPIGHGTDPGRQQAVDLLRTLGYL